MQEYLQIASGADQTDWNFDMFKGKLGMMSQIPQKNVIFATTFIMSKKVNWWLFCCSQN